MAAPTGEFRVVGTSVTRDRARRAVEGRGRYSDDYAPRRLVHAAFLRSPHPHARIVAIDTAPARDMPGVVFAATGRDIAAHCRPYTAIHRLFPGMRAPEQLPLAVDRARFQGEPVAVIVAETRAQAEDAVDRIAVEWDPLPAVASIASGLAGEPIHPQLGSNVAFDGRQTKGDFAAAARAAAVVVTKEFRFARHTGVCLETRSIVAEFDRTGPALTVTQSHQCPAQQQDIYAQLLGLPQSRVRVHCPDVGGAFGIKQQLYGDEIAVCVVSKLLGRPVKFVADRLESFMSDIHARDHAVTGTIALAADGRILGLAVDDRFGVGAFSQYPRSSVGEGSHVLRMSGGPYALEAYDARLRVVYQNRNMVGHYRSVGHPVAVAVTECLVEEAARRLGRDSLEVRRASLIPENAYPYASHGGFTFERLGLHECHDKIASMLRLPEFRIEQTRLRGRGIHRGVGLASFVELTGTGPEYYGRGEVRVTAQDGCLVKLEPSGEVRCTTSLTDQGQGTDTALQQVVAEVLGLKASDVAMLSGDSEAAPYGGGAWASRGAYVGAEAAHRAAAALRANILALAGHVLQTPSDTLALAHGQVVDGATGQARMTLADVARIGYFRQDLLPPGVQPELSVARHFVPQGRPFVMSCGVHASVAEVDTDTGIVRLLRHCVVHESGTVINPLLLDEQIRGGVVQGLGTALYEEIAYGPEGQLLTGTMADYLVPMAGEMPEIEVAHVGGRDPATAIGAKGAGEAGTAGASAAVLNAVNDALAPFGACLTELPLTPERVLRALGKCP